MSTEENRAGYIQGLRMLADALEANPDVPLPTGGSAIPLSWYAWRDSGQVAAVARGIPCDWAKETEGDDELAKLNLRGKLAGLSLKITTYRETVCTRRVTGTREVTTKVPDPEALAAVPEIEVTETVEDVEWDCHPVLAGDRIIQQPSAEQAIEAGRRAAEEDPQLTGDGAVVAGLTDDQQAGVNPAVAGTPFPGRPGYVTGLCGHAVAGSEWKAGFRVCERCPSPVMPAGTSA